ncbi:hypothetical protein BOTBODRAFT_625620 [Botryobasidium botryosum FD-172 SS1]|uniref:Uncharacterized protein n=1 Tax=Botryobasidium botryosum (strain FD-172 SS1) TaxID=930990 RepID=A0A067M2E8_BOTB1|nr:hypothetical protein BOTBODRAFT_625620 [Botryobasidium botryosum FD-172 SS1]
MTRLSKSSATEMGIASSSQYLGEAIVNGQQADVESSINITKIVHDDLALTILLIEPVGNGGGRRFAEDTKNGETSDGTGDGSVSMVAWH